MKVSTIIMTCAVFSAIATGCRYDKAAKGANSSGDAAANNGGVDDLAAESGSLEDIAAAGNGKSWEGLGYTRCTDVEFAPVYFAFDATAIQPSELGKIEAVAKHRHRRIARQDRQPRRRESGRRRHGRSGVVAEPPRRIPDLQEVRPPHGACLPL